MEYKKIGKIGIAVILVSLLFYLADISEIVGNLQRADNRMYLIGAFLFFSTYIPVSLRWRSLSKNVGYDLDFNTSLRIIAVSYSFNKIFPGNSGDVLRSKIFQRYKSIDNHGNILGIVTLERFMDTVALGIIIGFSAVFVSSNYFSTISLLLVPFTLIAVGLGLGLLLNEKWMHKLVGLTPIGENFFSDVMEGYRSCSRKSLGINLIYSVLIWSLEAFAFYFFIKALTLDLTFWDGALVTSLMSLVSGLPITPGGIGAVDATGTGLLVAAGVAYSSALSLVILQRSVGLVLMGLLGSIIYTVEETVGHKLSS